MCYDVLQVVFKVLVLLEDLSTRLKSHDVSKSNLRGAQRGPGHAYEVIEPGGIGVGEGRLNA